MADAVSIRELPPATRTIFRGGDTAVVLAGLVFGVGLPLKPCTVATTARTTVLWLGPDEWLVVGPPGGEAALERQLRDALGDLAPAAAIVDVSANRTTIELTGPDARIALESGCSIDLDARAFGPGRCAQTLLARANVLLQQLDDAPTYRIYVRPSFAAYVTAWLADAFSG